MLPPLWMASDGVGLNWSGHAKSSRRWRFPLPCSVLIEQRSEDNACIRYFGSRWTQGDALLAVVAALRLTVVLVGWPQGYRAGCSAVPKRHSVPRSWFVKLCTPAAHTAVSKQFQSNQRRRTSAQSTTPTIFPQHILWIHHPYTTQRDPTTRSPYTLVSPLHFP